MAWFYLGIAGIFEVVWAFAMKQSEGFTRPIPSIVTGLGMLASIWFLAAAMKVLPLGTAYVIWTGIGAVGAFVLGIVFLGESAEPLRLIAATMIILGLVLLKIATPH